MVGDTLRVGRKTQINRADFGRTFALVHTLDMMFAHFFFLPVNAFLVLVDLVDIIKGVFLIRLHHFVVKVCNRRFKRLDFGNCLRREREFIRLHLFGVFRDIFGVVADTLDIAYGVIRRTD